MNDDVIELLRRLQAISHWHDIRQVAKEVTRQAHKTQNKADFDYLGDIENTLQWLLSSVQESKELALNDMRG